ncbi:MAG: FAD-dependent monooxygenase, partial [Bartonella sp.]|nr:FAD-dependent monooxygenase [Bartonella sp.]
MTSYTDQTIKQCDLLIAGGGAVGLTLAIALKHAAPELRINVVDATSQSSTSPKNTQAFALSAASIRMLEQLQCWKHIKPYAQPIHSITITDARLNDPIKPIFL